jgi:hypothetical protein
MTNIDSEVNRALKGENDKLKEYLERSKSQLYKLLHEEEKAPDTTIMEEYLRICRSVETWIGNVSYIEKNFNHRFHEIFQEDQQVSKGKLANLRLYEPRHHENPYNIRSNQWMELLGSQNSCSYVVLSTLIWQYLDDEVFSEYFPIGTLDSSHDFLNDIIDVMEDRYRNRGWCSYHITCPSRSGEPAET